MPSHPPVGANFTFQISSIANAAKKNSNSAERRANHNAVERARRECLNTKFQELAHALPALAQVRRPSKSVIVQKSLDFIYGARQREDVQEKELRSVRGENESLREEINRLREQLGLPPLPPREEPLMPQPDHGKEEVNSSTNATKKESIEESGNSVGPLTPDETASPFLSMRIKSEETRSEDDYSCNTDDDFDFEASELLDGSGMMYHNLLDHTINTHGGYPSSEFNYSMGLQPMVESSTLQYEASEIKSPTGITLCQPFPISQKFYPSPPYDGLLELSGDISGFSMPMEQHDL